MLQKYDCFLLENAPAGRNADDYKDHANEQFTFYIKFLTKLNQLMVAYLVILLFIFILLSIVTVSYSLVRYTQEEKEVEEGMEHFDEFKEEIRAIYLKKTK